MTQRTVLIVDDREENRYTTRHALTRAGFLTTEAATGQQALEMSQTLPDVIVLDVRLPDMLGYEVCRRLRANPHTSHIPVLQLSSTFLTTEAKLYALESGADAYLTQPADPLVLVATVRSLIRLHDAEQQAQTAARQWAATFDALSEGVALIDNGVVQRCNRAMTELLAARYNELEGASFADLLQRYFNVDAHTLLRERHAAVQLESRFFELKIVALPVNDKTTGDIFLVADTTAQKQAEQALLLNERLAATGRMAHTIAHEINNPLASITNLIFLAQHAAGLPAEAQDFLKTAAQEVDRIAKISRQILSFNREATRPIDIPIAELVEDVLSLIERSASEKHLLVDVHADHVLTVTGYPARLRQAFSNIIRNAIEASPEGGRIRVRVTGTTMQGPTSPVPAVRVTIGDGGAGIPLAHCSKIFEAFYTTKSNKGSGIGLWLTLTIVDEHAGKLQLRTCTAAVGHGTCFSILLPVSGPVLA